MAIQQRGSWNNGVVASNGGLLGQLQSLLAHADGVCSVLPCARIEGISKRLKPNSPRPDLQQGSSLQCGLFDGLVPHQTSGSTPGRSPSALLHQRPNSAGPPRGSTGLREPGPPLASRQVPSDSVERQKKELEDELERDLKLLAEERKEGLHRIDWQLAEAVEALHADMARKTNERISRHKEVLAGLEGSSTATSSTARMQASPRPATQPPPPASSRHEASARHRGPSTGSSNGGSEDDGAPGVWNQLVSFFWRAGIAGEDAGAAIGGWGTTGAASGTSGWPAIQGGSAGSPIAGSAQASRHASREPVARSNLGPLQWRGDESSQWSLPLQRGSPPEQGAAQRGFSRTLEHGLPRSAASSAGAGFTPLPHGRLAAAGHRPGSPQGFGPPPRGRFSPPSSAKQLPLPPPPAPLPWAAEVR